MGRSIKYSLKGGLNKKELNAIYQGTLKILEEIGLEIDHPGILKKLRKYNGVKVVDKRVYYKPQLVEKFLEEIREKEKKAKKSEKFLLSGPFACVNIWDMNTGEVRPSTRKDLRDVLRFLGAALDIHAAYIPLQITDIPPKLQAIAALKICLEETGNPWGNHIKSIEELDYINEMAEAAGKIYPCISLQIPISPLKLDAPMLDIVWKAKDKYKKIITVSSGTIPLFGCNAPLSLPAAWSQSLAEGIGGYITSKLIDAEIAASCTFLLYPFDFKFTAPAVGAPESVILHLAGRQILKSIFGSGRNGNFRSMAKGVNIQAGVERLASVFLDALDGVRAFGGAGSTPMDEAFSFELAVIDNEILHYVERVIKGIEIGDLSSGIGIIKEIVKDPSFQNSFISHPSTLNYKEFYWFSQLFHQSTLTQWKRDGSQDIIREARQIASEKINEYKFTLDNNIQKEVDKIYKKASSTL